MPNVESFKSKEEYRKWYSNYRKKNNEKLKIYNRQYIKKWRSKNGTEKDKVRKLLYHEIANNKIVRGLCEVCGNQNAEGHHFDYSKPLEVIWLCPVHHKDMHRKL